MTLKLYPNCKINIGLDVLGRLTDGYHQIETLLVPIPNLVDTITIKTLSGARDLLFTTTMNDPAAGGESNLCVRAYRAVAQHYTKVSGVDIHLEKKIPSGAGLGGGSSDAAAIIVGLNQIFGLGMSGAEMETLGAQIGSDVPFFIDNKMQFASGRGEILERFTAPQLAGKSIVIIKPDINISTAEAYSEVVPRYPESPLKERLNTPLKEWKELINNQFEQSLFPKYPILREIKASLYEAGALYASMSGSGSAIYAIFATSDEALAASDNLAREYRDIFLHHCSL